MPRTFWLRPASSVYRRFSTLVICLTAALASGISPSEAGELENSDTLNQIFDENRSDSIDLLVDMYNQSNILVLGQSNHAHAKTYELLGKLLDRVGTDPRLKRIYIERDGDVAGFFEQLSVHSLPAALKRFKFPEPAELSRTNNLCITQEYAYTVAEFFPKVQAINRKRPLGNKLLFTSSIDANVSNRDPFYPAGYPYDDYLKKIKLTRHCDAGDIKKAPPFYFASANHQEESGARFEKEILPRLKKNEKIIVLYHYAHVLKRFQACGLRMIDELEWITAREPMNWISFFLRRVPDAEKRMRVVMLEEKDAYQNPEGALRLTQSQASRYPGEDFAYPLSPFRSHLRVRGLAAFMPNSILTFYKRNRSMAILPDILDGVVWNHNSQSKYAYKKTAAQYLPGICKAAPGSDSARKQRFDPWRIRP